MVEMSMLNSSFSLMYGNWWHIMIYIMLLIFIIDILIKFNTGVVIKGTLVKKRFIIAKYYRENMLFYDLLSLIPLIFGKFIIYIIILKKIKLIYRIKWNE